MSKIHLETPAGNSEILIQRNGLDEAREWIEQKHPGRRLAIITDSNLNEHYRERLAEVFRDAIVLVVAAGEDTKNPLDAANLVKELSKHEFDKGDVVTGFGGGMVTDLAGFVASTYKRGAHYTAIPTSLLAMVDAAIGGKTGVNVAAKNDMGTFYLAEHVLLDAELLKTLPKREFNSGMAEVIKYAATLDASLAKDLMRDELDLDTILEKSARAKVSVVQQDVKEDRLRQVLNFGHTFGHAIESQSDYALLHGEAISIGMIQANKVAQKLGKQQPETDQMIRRLLERFELPIELPKDMTVEDLLPYIVRDKKKSGKEISFIIAPEMGKYEMLKLTPEELMKMG
ncbi:3-dehydroquinate synthase [Candidatus Peregrinibacteria bacterium]|nr:3-dehydroquinate synthase [Candidatus Peregrinibacteria bacterium]